MSICGTLLFVELPGRAGRGSRGARHGRAPVLAIAGAAHDAGPDLPQRARHRSHRRRPARARAARRVAPGDRGSCSRCGASAASPAACGTGRGSGDASLTARYRALLWTGVICMAPLIAARTIPEGLVGAVLAGWSSRRCSPVSTHWWAAPSRPGSRPRPSRGCRRRSWAVSPPGRLSAAGPWRPPGSAPRSCSRRGDGARRGVGGPDAVGAEQPRRSLGPRLSDLAEHSAGVARAQVAGREITEHDAARPHHGAGADRDPRADDDAGGQPRAVLHDDRLGPLQLGAPLDGIERMGGGDQVHPGADLHVVADADRSGVQDDHAEVQERPGADGDLVAVVALKRGEDLGGVADLSQQRAQELLAGERLGDAGGVELLGEQPAAVAVLEQLWIVGQVGLAGQQPVLVRGHPDDADRPVGPVLTARRRARALAAGPPQAPRSAGCSASP